MRSVRPVSATLAGRPPGCRPRCRCREPPRAAVPRQRHGRPAEAAAPVEHPAVREVEPRDDQRDLLRSAGRQEPLPEHPLHAAPGGIAILAGHGDLIASGASAFQGNRGTIQPAPAILPAMIGLPLDPFALLVVLFGAFAAGFTTGWPASAPGRWRRAAGFAPGRRPGCRRWWRWPRWPASRWGSPRSVGPAALRRRALPRRLPPPRAGPPARLRGRARRADPDRTRALIFPRRRKWATPRGARGRTAREGAPWPIG